MKKVLCYGDSNTWGYSPADGLRFSKDVRWPLLMTRYLKDDYRIIEEGLNGRSALNLYPGYDEANGIDCIKKIIGNHVPVDIALIFLGLNDIFAAPDEPLWKIANAIEEIAEIIKDANISSRFHSPEIILIGLPKISLSPAEAQFYEIAINKIHAFPELLAQSALKRGYHFIDIYGKIKTSPIDGTHLNDKEHKKLAQITANYLNRLL
jgi:lysophospholipase L1-like esterase